MVELPLHGIRANRRTWAIPAGLLACALLGVGCSASQRMCLAPVPPEPPLADLMERSGDLARARELFLRVGAAEPGAYDVDDRLEALGPPSASRRRPNRSPGAR